MDFLIEMIYLFMIVVHHKLFGDPTVTYVATGRTVKLDYVVENNTYSFKSEQYICTVIHAGLLKYKSKFYVYSVKLITDSENMGTNIEGYYGRMSPLILGRTSYPHRRAINAHFKQTVSNL